MEATRSIANHSFVFVGGTHRGGTTLIWRCLRFHPQIGGFPDRTGGDFSEGLFLQSVYPTWGISGEGLIKLETLIKGKRKGPPLGLGRFAFNPEAHLTEDTPIVTDANRLRLFRQWGYFWDLSAPTLLEKSPTNLISSRFLQAMFGATSGNRPSANGASEHVSFVFTTRHPLAVALAHKRWDWSVVQ